MLIFRTQILCQKSTYSVIMSRSIKAIAIASVIGDSDNKIVHHIQIPNDIIQFVCENNFLTSADPIHRPDYEQVALLSFTLNQLTQHTSHQFNKRACSQNYYVHMERGGGEEEKIATRATSKLFPPPPLPFTTSVRWSVYWIDNFCAHSCSPYEIVRKYRQLLTDSSSHKKHMHTELELKVPSIQGWWSWSFDCAF